MQGDGVYQPVGCKNKFSLLTYSKPNAAETKKANVA